MKLLILRRDPDLLIDLIQRKNTLSVNCQIYGGPTCQNKISWTHKIWWYGVARNLQGEDN